MKASDFAENRWGELIQVPTGFLAFKPADLPPELDMTMELACRLSEADRAVAGLGGAARNLPNPHLLIRPFIRREAVLSSRIEGTQASLSDLFFFEAAEDPAEATRLQSPDVQEVANYVRALEHGIRRLADLPLSQRLIREIHGVLMHDVRGERQAPGEFRRTQNWIGPPGCTLMDATYVPPPVPEMQQALSALEKYLHEPGPLPPLIRLAQIHYQFEAIHPFLDGNGRVGRLLISLLTVTEGLLPQPLLYLSAFFEQHRPDYYRLLLGVSQRGEWLSWIEFFLAGVAEQALDALRRTARLLDLWKDYRSRVASARSSALLLRLVDELFNNPVISIPKAGKVLVISPPAATNNIRKLVDSGILAAVPDRRHPQLFLAQGIFDAIERGL